MRRSDLSSSTIYLPVNIRWRAESSGGRFEARRWSLGSGFTDSRRTTLALPRPSSGYGGLRGDYLSLVRHPSSIHTPSLGEPIPRHSDPSSSSIPSNILRGASRRETGPWHWRRTILAMPRRVHRRGGSQETSSGVSVRRALSVHSPCPVSTS